MRKLLSGIVIVLLTGSLVACGIKSPPKYVPETPKAEPAKSSS